MFSARLTGITLTALLGAALLHPAAAQDKQKRERPEMHTPAAAVRAPRLLSLEDILQEQISPSQTFAPHGALFSRSEDDDDAPKDTFHLVTPGDLLAFARTVPRRSLVPVQSEEIVGQPWRGQPGITESIEDIMQRQNALDAAGLGHPAHPEPPEHGGPDPAQILPDPNAPAVANWPPENPVLLTGTNRRGRQNPQAIGVNFGATNFGTARYYPPDTQFAVGPSQILVVVNGNIVLYNRDGSYPNILNASTDSFFSSVVGSGYVGDPRVRYDRTSQRWFVTMISVPTSGSTILPNRILLAVSSGPVITGRSSFTFYGFSFDQTPPTSTSDTGAFGDFDTLAVDANALYIGTNAFQPSNYAGSTLFVIRKSSVTSGGPIVVTVFRDIKDVYGSAFYTPQGADNDDPNATTGYIVNVSQSYYGQLNLIQVKTPGGTPALSSPYAISVPMEAYPDRSPALGSNEPLDGSDRRLFAAQVHRNRLLNTTSLWTAQATSVDSTGTGSTSGDRNAIRWYEIQNINGTGTGTNGPVMKQAGTLYDPAATSPLFYTFGTIAMSGQGSAALGSSASGAASYTKIALSGRLNTNAPGSTQAAAFLSPDTGNYNLGDAGGYYRWGDYSFTTVDPNDDMTFWTAQMYGNSSGSWSVHVAQLLAPPPPTPTALTPGALTQGQTATVTLTATSSGGAAFFDPLPEYAKHISAAFSNPAITISNLALVLPASPSSQPVVKLTMKVTVPANMPTGVYALTITNPDGQSVMLSNALTVNPPPVRVSGNITLLNLTVSPPPVTPQNIQIDFRTPGTTNVLFSQTVAIGASSAFQTGNVTPGKYDLAFKGIKYLRSVVPNVDISSASATNISVSLTPGDSDDNNVVDIGDFGILVNAYGSDMNIAGSNYDQTADFNDDGVVDIADFGILVNNYGTAGAN